MNEQSIWRKEINLEALNNFHKGLSKHVGIQFTEVGENYLTARMPVDERTHQPFGLLHGGASVVLAESLGSVAGYFCIQDADKTVVGVEINANHLRSVRSGYVYGKAVPIRVGRKLQVWNIEIVNEAEELICVSRITMAVVNLMR